MNENINCGDILKRKDDGIFAIVLSYDNPYWKIGDFWFSNECYSASSWGGARQRELTDNEITDKYDVIGHLSNFLK